MRQIYYEVDGKEYDTLSEAKANGYTEDLGKVVFKELSLDEIFYNTEKGEENGTD